MILSGTICLNQTCFLYFKLKNKKFKKNYILQNNINNLKKKGKSVN